jgi:hypothetical protein
MFSTVIVLAALANLLTCYGQNQNLNWTLINDDNGIVTATSQFATVGSDGTGQHLVLANENTIVTSDDFGDILFLTKNCC